MRMGSRGAVRTGYPESLWIARAHGVQRGRAHGVVCASLLLPVVGPLLPCALLAPLLRLREVP